MQRSSSSHWMAAGAMLLLCLSSLQWQSTALQPQTLQRLVHERCGTEFAANLSMNDTFLVFLRDGMQQVPSQMKTCHHSTSGPCDTMKCEYTWPNLPEAGLAHSVSWCTSSEAKRSLELSNHYTCGNRTVLQMATRVLGSCQGVAVMQSFKEWVFDCRLMKQ